MSIGSSEGLQARSEGETAVRSGTKVLVGMATYRRPELLAALLPKVLDQIAQVEEQAGTPSDLGVLVVDNDADGSARSVVAGLDDARVRYVLESQPGISSARNRLLDEAAGHDVLVLIDDDETPHPGWLGHLLRAYSAHAADAVSGPVHPVFEGGEDPWIIAGGSYRGQVGQGRPTGTERPRAATNNLLLDMNRVRELGLRFDARLGLTGGEDSLFTGQLTGAGGRIVWCADAVVDDLVPAARNTRRYNLSRRFAQSASHVRVEQLILGSRAARLQGWARWLGTGLGQVVKGAALTVAGVLMRNLPRRARGESRVASGLGVLAGCIGVFAAPYARPSQD